MILYTHDRKDDESFSTAEPLAHRAEPNVQGIAGVLPREPKCKWARKRSRRLDGVDAERSGCSCACRYQLLDRDCTFNSFYNALRDGP